MIPLIAEVFGGLTPHGYRFLVHLSRVAAEHTTRDTTKYSKCAASYLTYHSQRISHAIVMTDALSITREILHLKKTAYGLRPAH